MPKRQPVASGQQPVALKGKKRKAAENCTATQSRGELTAACGAVQKRWRKRKADKMCAEDASRLVGDARETESEHRARHLAGKGWEKVCVGMTHWDSSGENKDPLFSRCAHSAGPSLAKKGLDNMGMRDN